MEIKLEGNRLTITTDLGNGVSSKSGKTLIMATTSGFITVAGHPELRVSLNVIKSK